MVKSRIEKEDSRHREWKIRYININGGSEDRREMQSIKREILNVIFFESASGNTQSQ